MQEFYDALQGGDVPKFVMEVSPRIGLEELPQVSSGESTGLTQISIASSSSQTPSAAAAEGDTDDLEEKSAVPVQDESAADHDVQDEDARESGAPSTEEAERRPTSASSDTGPAQNSTEMVPEKPSEGSKDDPISFSQPPRVRGLSKREKRRIAGDKELREARKLAVKIRDGKKTRKVRLDDVAALLEGAYSMDVAKSMVDALDLEDVEVQGSLSVRPFNVGQRVPKITKILQLDKIHEAITAIKAKGNLNLLANWSDFGYATLDLLEAMARVLEARNRFRLVQFTLDWIDGVEWHIKDVVHPFTDVCDYTKNGL
ncbi:hypothetical protein PF003_g13368 [Phytophthora fragariae]|nr:hypothetical protein PF003_g13368 [Phytophthora fragariae]